VHDSELNDNPGCANNPVTKKTSGETQVMEIQVSVLEQLAELEAMLRSLTLAALKLPPGEERRDCLRLIGRFRERIGAIKQAEFDRANIMQAFKMSA
jgi:hypothetical protein